MIRRRFTMLGLALVGAALAMGAAPATAANTQVAVAANFTEPAKAIAAAFKVRTGHTATLSFGASGQVYTQIAHGAPYEVFLSADAERPRMAEAEGLAVPGARFTYAVGRLVLYSRTPGLVDARGAVLRSDRFAKLAIADPTAAPYGLAAVQTLRTLKVYDAVEPRIVKGASITQAYQYVATGNAELGLRRPVPGGGPAGRFALDRPERRSRTDRAAGGAAEDGPRKNPAARAFLTFLKSPAAAAIIRRYGYETRR